jgi:sigma-B regulation protein RsbU (phosphoserine phosphatase)
MSSVPGEESSRRAVVAPGTSAGLDNLLADLVSQASEALGADTAAVLLLDSTRTYLDTTAATGLALNVMQRARVMVGRGFAGIVASERRAVVIDRVTPENVINPLLHHQGVQSLLGVPLLDEDRLLGVLHVGSFTQRAFTDEDAAALRGVAERVGHALRASLERANLSAAALIQASLLPGTLLALPGLTMAARYIPAEGHLGGDWYDVFALPEGWVGFVIGDVAGHGLPAATIMGRLRSALRAYALEHHDPAGVLTSLDAKISHFEPGVFATVLYGVSAPPYRTFEFSSAGHLAPLVRNGPSPAGFAAVPPDLPLGVGAFQARRQTTIEVPDGANLLLFTDGLVERRPPALTRSGLEELATALGTGDPEEECAGIVETMFRATRPRDDATMLLVGRRS